MEYVIDFINYIVEIIKGFPDIADNFWERSIKWLMITYYELKLDLLEFGYSIVQGFIQSIGLSEVLAPAWSGINSQILGAFTFFRIPEGINLLLSAFVLRFILGILPI